MKKLLCSLAVISATCIQVHAAMTVWTPPSGSGSYSSWNPSLTVPNYTNVDESSCNGNVDYVSTATSGAKDSYSVSLVYVPVDTKITDIYIQPCLSQEAATGTTAVALFYRLNGVDSPLSTTYTITGTSSRNYQYTRFFPGYIPKTSTTTLEIGVQYLGGDTGVRLSRIAMVIGYAIPVPVAPTNLNSTLAATTTGGYVNLTWNDNANNESYYLVEKSTDGVYFSNIAVLPLNTTSYRTALLSTGKYYFRVRAYNSGGYSTYSNITTTTVAPLVTIPLAPSGLSIIASTTAVVYWNDNSLNETGFVLERSIDGVTFTVYGTTYFDQPYYYETETTPGTYYYRVKAYNSAGSSGYSNIAVYTIAPPTPPVAPSLLMVSLASSTPTNLLPILSWSDNSNNETGFIIERQIGIDTGYVQLGAVPANMTYFVDTTANAAYNANPILASTIMYRVVATNAGGRSASTDALSSPSNELEVKNAPMNLFIFLGSSTPSTFVPRIFWDDTSSNESGFTIERKVGISGTYTAVGTVGANQTSFVDLAVNDAYNLNPIANTLVSYRVTAFNNFGKRTSVEAVMSVIGELGVKAAPSNLTVMYLASSTPTAFTPVLQWTDNSYNEEEFMIERQVGVSGIFSKIGSAPANMPVFFDVTASDIYFADPVTASTIVYRVTATNHFGNSASAVVWFMPASYR